MDLLDGRIGEAWSGEVPNESHINVVVGRRGSATAAAIVAALASPRQGHLPFLACLEWNKAVRPMTVIVNKSTLESVNLRKLTWGAVQLGIAQGVLDAVADGVIDAAEAPELVLLATAWVDPIAHDETGVRKANREAMRAAVADAVKTFSFNDVQLLVARREDAKSIYYSGI